MTTSKNCNSCYSCYYCKSCNFCNFCNFCKNLKMTERNLFCYSKLYNDEASFQQKRYRAFNKEVSKDRYSDILNKVNSILNHKDENLTDFWKSITQGQWQQLLAIPEAKDFKKGFEFISGQKINDKYTIVIDGKNIELSKESFEALKKQMCE